MDNFTKLLLALVAAGLWANVAIELIRPAYAQDANLLRNIESELGKISRGTCTNSKIC
jgi:hypothetical protein